MSPYTVMIVDDEPLIRAGLKKIIQRTAPKWEVVCEAANGKEAVPLFYSHHPDLIITDICMPEQDGLQFLQEVKESGRDPYCLVLSGYAEFEYLHKAMKIGVVDYLLKPVQENMLHGYLTKVQEKIMNQMHHQWIRQKEMEVQRQYWFQQVIGPQYGNANPFEQDLALLGIDADRARFTVVCFQIDDMEALADWDKSMYLYFLYKSVQEMIEEECIIVYGGDSGVNVLVWHEDASVLQEALAVICSKIIAYVQSVTPLTITSGISEAIDSPLLIRQAWEQARLAIRYKMIWGSSQVISWRQIEPVENANRSMPIDFSKQLLVELHRGDLNRIETLITDYFNEAVSLNCSPRQLRKLYLVCLVCLEEYAAAAGASIESVTGTGFFAIMEQFDRYNRCRDIVEGLVRLSRKILESQAEGSRQYPPLILKVQQYIKDHLGSSQLTLQSAADFVHLHPNYLSEFFKQYTGKKFIDYVTELRIQLAKQMLKETGLRWQDISARVGYHSSKYFSTLFRNTVGLSPSEYRKRLQK